MKLLSQELEEKFNSTRLYSTDGQGFDAEVLAKFHIEGTPIFWLITEAEKQEDGDYLLFGYCHILESEWGYVMLSELENTEPPYGLKIEIDQNAHGKVKDLCGSDHNRDFSFDDEER